MNTDPTFIRKRSVLIAGHRTSVSLEDAFWQALGAIATAQGDSVNQLVTRLDAERTSSAPDGNLSGYLRVYVLQDAQRAGKSKT